MGHFREKWPIFFTSSSASPAPAKNKPSYAVLSFIPQFAVLSNRQFTTTPPHFTIVYTTIRTHNLQKPPQKPHSTTNKISLEKVREK
jgi:hypothetical protein